MKKLLLKNTCNIPYETESDIKENIKEDLDKYGFAIVPEFYNVYEVDVKEDNKDAEMYQL
jgi:hypothetical protein